MADSGQGEGPEHPSHLNPYMQTISENKNNLLRNFTVFLNSSPDLCAKVGVSQMKHNGRNQKLFFPVFSVCMDRASDDIAMRGDLTCAQSC